MDFGITLIVTFTPKGEGDEALENVSEVMTQVERVVWVAVKALEDRKVIESGSEVELEAGSL